MDNISIYFLFKFGEDIFMRQLWEQGIIYMNPIQYFIDYEEKELRGDENEGLSGIFQTEKVTLLVEGKELGYSKSARLKYRDKNLRGNIYSLMAISSFDKDRDFRIDPKNKKLGNKFVAIHDVLGFMDRIETKLKENNYDYKYGIVEYYDEKGYSGDLDVFCKCNRFAYQKEFRLFINRDETAAIKIEIGPMKDIALLLDTDILSELSVNFPSA
jgi:hypothetical protein